MEWVQRIWSNIQKNLKGDYVIWMVVFVLSLISILAVYSSTSALSFRFQNGNTEYYLFKHVILMVASFGIMFIIHHINYRFLANISFLLILISVILLFYTLFQGQDAEINSANRWITIFGQSFQPSDFAKFSLMVFLAKMLTEKQEVIKDFYKGFLPIILVVGFITLLIAPANFSTAALLFTCSIILMFVAGISIKHILGLKFIGLVMVIFLLNADRIVPGHLFHRAKTWRHRISDFSEQWVGTKEPNFQTQQANIAIASGGILGKGAGKSVQRNFLPHPYSDFVFAIILEEWGFLGASIVISCYLIFLFRCILIVTVSKTFGALLAAGLGFLITTQALVNIGVNVGVLPVTGLSLPLISMGGTSLFFTAASIGVILSVSRSALEESIPAPTPETGNTLKYA